MIFNYIVFKFVSMCGEWTSNNKELFAFFISLWCQDAFQLLKLHGCEQSHEKQVEQIHRTEVSCMINPTEFKGMNGEGTHGSSCPEKVF